MQSSSVNQPPQSQKMCKACFEAIHPEAEICPKCGVRQFHSLNKVALLLMTFFLGGLGAHKFYLGKPWQGVFYVLFCWTGIPALIAFIEFLIYAFTDVKQLQNRYPDVHGGGVGIALACGVGVMVVIAIIGILAAIAIPQFAAYRQKAACAGAENDAQMVSVFLSQYLVENDQRPLPGLDELAGQTDYSPSAIVEIELTGTREQFTIKASPKRTPCANGTVYVINEPPDPEQDGWQQ